MNCSKCGAANPPDKKFCRQCGSPLNVISPPVSSPRQEIFAAAGMACAQCGATVPAGKAFCSKCGAPINAPSATPVQSVGTAPSAIGSIQASLEKLGIRVSPRELIGFGVSVVAGMVMARVLPYIYPVLFSSIISRMQNPDPFNKFMMTAITFLTSFVISFIAFRKP
jgi:ribosomal protein L40E